MESRALERIAAGGLVDRVAVTLSGLCLVHCLATALLVGALSSAGALLGSPLVHETGLALAIILGAVALGAGIFQHGLFLPPSVGGFGLGMMAGALTLPHGGGETTATMLGVGMLALGHFLNRMALA